MNYKKGEASCFVLKIAASQGLLFLYQSINFYSIVRINTQKLNNFSGYDTIWQHAPVILRLVNHKFRAKLTHMVNQYGATLYKQIHPKGECGD
ncbi:hypothetical protein BFS16_12245 [Hoylesella timonensis]|uniref:Uncharacterized protein n=2 Tax=Hoylesella timonensis TaxID=386414 RepID=A0A098YUD0_9BACT|nr:hypothetical protein HMPREF9304_01525 [Hoylesella timonensis S9-PR14]PNP91228.1 hypothetical protein BFS16_12245 [Hoylesella timonensis]